MFFPEQYYTMIVFGRDIDIYVGNPFSFFFLPLLTVHIKKNIHLNHFISLFIETCYCEILVA